MKNKLIKKFLFIIIVAGIYLFIMNTNVNAAYISTDINGIDSLKYPGYKEKLQQLKSQYPNWNFKLLYTGLDWNTVIQNEDTGHGSSPKSLIHDTYDISWFCQKDTCKNRKYDVSQRWKCASTQAIKYMMDPRNSLDAGYIFQFQNLGSSSGNRSEIEQMTNNTFLGNITTVDSIMEAAATYNISPFHLVSRVLQEQGTSGLGNMNGYVYTTSENKKVVVYNLFNINVSGNTAAGFLQGAKFAYEQGWTTREKSIIGGAKFLREKYIDKGQSTLYFQKYNVIDTNNLYSHQYMQNIRAANDEGNNIYKTYNNSGILKSHFEFIIPIYENMPQQAEARPKYVPVQQITTEQDTYVIGVNEVIDIKYGYLPNDASNTSFSWTASNSDILSVYWNKVRGLKEGTAEIIIRTEDGSVEKKIKVIVKPKVQDIKFEKDEYTIGINEVIDIKYSCLPSNASNIDFTWTASDSNVLSVYWNKVRGLKEGTSYIIVKTSDGSIEKRIKVNVKENTKTEIIPEQESYEIKSNEVINIKCTYSPSNLTEQDFTWTATDTSVLSVYWNKVRGLKSGTSQVVIRSLDGKIEKRITVVVKKESDGINIIPEQESYEIKSNEVINIECTYSPSNLTEQDFTWTATDTSVLSVYWNKVRGLKSGTSQVIIKSLDGKIEKRITVIVSI